MPWTRGAGRSKRCRGLDRSGTDRISRGPRTPNTDRWTADSRLQIVDCLEPALSNLQSPKSAIYNLQFLLFFDFVLVFFLIRVFKVIVFVEILFVIGHFPFFVALR